MTKFEYLYNVAEVPVQEKLNALEIISALMINGLKEPNEDSCVDTRGLYAYKYLNLAMEIR